VQQNRIEHHKNSGNADPKMAKMTTATSFGAKNIPRFSHPKGPGPSDEEHSPGHSPEHLQNLSTPMPRPSKSRGISVGSSPPGAEERFAFFGEQLLEITKT
jgi:hypothetical protein